jgi:uncharacterized protein (UPF0248 family)
LVSLYPDHNEGSTDDVCLIASKHILSIGDRGDDTQSDSAVLHVYYRHTRAASGSGQRSKARHRLVQVADGCNGRVVFESTAAELDLNMNVIMDNKGRP